MCRLSEVVKCGHSKALFLLGCQGGEQVLLDGVLRYEQKHLHRPFLPHTVRPGDALQPQSSRPRKPNSIEKYVKNDYMILHLEVS